MGRKQEGEGPTRSHRCQAGVGEVGREMQRTSLSPHLEVPEVITEGAAPAGTHGCVVQTGGHTLGYSLVPELHPALCVVLAVLGPLFPSRGRGCRCLLLAPHEPTCVPEREQSSGHGDGRSSHSPHCPLAESSQPARRPGSCFKVFAGEGVENCKVHLSSLRLTPSFLNVNSSQNINGAT